MTQPEDPVICFGDRCILDGVVQLRIEGKLKSGFVVVRTSALIEADVNYAAEVRLYRRRDPSDATAPDANSREFTGRVVEADPGPELTRIQLASMPAMNRPFAGEWSTAAGMPVAELIWSLARDTGMPESRLDFDGFRRIAELFEVAAPLDGVAIDSPVRIAGVVVTNNLRVASLVARFQESNLREDFASATAWAVAVVTAGTAWEAERKAVAQIELALALITLRLGFSDAHLNGVPRRFHRDWTLARPRHRQVVAVRSVSGRRQWLRYIGPGADSPDAHLGGGGETTEPRLRRGASTQVAEAVRAWHRAATEREPATALGALWESIEFYAAGVELPTTFRKADLKRIRSLAAGSLNDRQQSRLADVLARANEPSLMPKVEERMQSDGVPYDTEDIELLRSVRQIRNDFVHGRSRASVGEEQLEGTLAIVNRMLSYRLMRIDDPGWRLSSLRSRD